MNTIFLRPVLHGLIWLLFFFSAVSEATPTIAWAPISVSKQVATGETITIPVTFTNSENISNVLVRVDPKLTSFVTTTPSSFASIAKGPITIDLNISVAASAPIGTFDGTIQLKDGGNTNATFAKPLPVTIRVEQGNDSFSTLPDPDKVVIDPDGGVYPVNQLMVNLIDEATRYDADTIASGVGGKVIGYIPSANMYQFQVPADTIAQLRAIITTLEFDSRVESAFTNHSVGFDGVVSDLGSLKSIGGCWVSVLCTIAYDNIKVQDAWDAIEKINPPLKKVTVGIVDSGFDTTHPEFYFYTVSDSLHKFDNVTYDYTPEPGCNPSEGAISHGTGVAGIIGANNIYGTSLATQYTYPQMNGILSGNSANPKLNYSLIIRPTCNFFATARAKIDTVIKNGAQIVNMSFGSYNRAVKSTLPVGATIDDHSYSPDFIVERDSYLETFRTYLNVLFVASAGNGYVKDEKGIGIDAKDHLPGGGISSPNLITVGAMSTSDGTKLGFSNFGGGVTIAAPGENIWAPNKYTFKAPPASGVDYKDYSNFGGTSGSTPMVTGVAGLIRAIKPTLDATTVRKILVDTGTPIPPDSNPVDQTIGPHLNAYAAVCHPSVLHCSTTIQFEGTVAYISSQNLEFPSIKPGDKIWGSYDLDLKTQDLQPNSPLIGSYYGVSNLIVHIGAYTYKSKTFGPFRLTIYNNYSDSLYPSPFDLYSIGGIDLVGPDISNWTPERFTLSLGDSTANAFSSDALPQTPPSPAIFDNFGPGSFSYLDLRFKDKTSGITTAYVEAKFEQHYLP